MKHGILQVLAAYDNEREQYIEKLEKKIAALEKKLGELTELSVRQADTSSALLLKGIIAGAFDRQESDSPP